MSKTVRVMGNHGFLDVDSCCPGLFVDVLQNAQNALQPAWKAINENVPQEVVAVIDEALESLRSCSPDAQEKAYEAMNHALGALPDIIFAEKHGFHPSVIRDLNAAVEAIEKEQEEADHSPR